MTRWIIGGPPGPPDPAPDPDPDDWCPACTYHWTACVCSDAVTPHPSEL